MRPATVTAAPELEVAAWLNAHGSPSLAALRGKVVVVYAFQMLCPGCVSHGIPQAKKIAATFDRGDVEVLGLHTVFEHHAVMGRDALEAFLHEYRIDFPVGIDQPSDSGPVPRTMARYRMRGTPTLLLIDRQGMLRQQVFGMADDMQVGALVAGLVHEYAGEPQCDEGGCRIPLSTVT
ncbi:TlpA disulfide reductase family protein [Pseudoduganella albidiflava]|uniref:TlpA family protein disulfide reductase n=1 Tax=Pseudoduganella albidiflava TaxID=321983 RepID=A0ABX5RWX4_9BURK|nr:TlpA disulfide reductase family protein [Pseudoduganella albidiflava]QBI02330.1 TlpA family protein disulfide reductase [Pseudoduganella albidiflava]